MDVSCFTLGCLVLMQMTSILVLLNPTYDLRRLSKYINSTIRYRKSYLILTIIIYFGVIIYYGMIKPLQTIHDMISDTSYNEFQKITLLSQIEKNYIITGFSLFLFIVLYGVRSLVMYAANLLSLSIATTESLPKRKSTKENGELYPENILPNLLRVKRSVSYETIMFASEFRDRLKTILKNNELPHNSRAISNILYSNVNKQSMFQLN